MSKPIKESNKKITLAYRLTSLTYSRFEIESESSLKKIISILNLFNPFINSYAQVVTPV